MGCCGSKDEYAAQQTASRPAARPPPPAYADPREQDAHVDVLPDLPFPETTYCSVPCAPQAGGLLTNLRDAVLRELLPVDAGARGAVLVVEERGLCLLETVVKVNDLTRVGIPLVERLEKSRQPLPAMPAVYLCEPTEANAARIGRDFETKANFYKAAHVFVTSEPMPGFKNALRAQVGLRKRLHTLKVVKVEFVCNAENFYVLHPAAEGTEDTGVGDIVRFWGRFSTHMHHARSARRVAEGILNACATLGDRPHVRFQKDSTVAELVAGEVIRGLDRVYAHRAAGDTQVHDTTGPTLLVLDRTVDLLTPLLHFFTYEAMLHDLLPGRPEGTHARPKYNGAVLEAVRGGSKDDTRPVPLDDTDPQWGSLRYDHFDVLRTRVPGDLRRMLDTSKAAKVHPELRARGGGADVGTSEFREGVQDLPKFQRATKSLGVHIDLLAALQRDMDDQRLDRVALAEQDFASGETPNARHELKKLERKKALKMLEGLLGRDGGTSGAAYRNKIRLVLIFAIAQGGLKGEERDRIRRLLGEAHPHEASVDSWLNGLACLHVDTERESTPWFKKIAKRLPSTGSNGSGGGARERQALLGNAGDDAYLLSRAVPRLQGVLAGLVHHSINQDEYPAMGRRADVYCAPAANEGPDGVSQRPRRPSWAAAAGSTPPPPPARTPHGPRIHVFIVGGVAPAELQVAAALQAETGREIVVGGSEMLTPDAFIDAVAALTTPPTRSA